MSEVPLYLGDRSEGNRISQTSGLGVRFWGQGFGIWFGV